MRLSPLGYRRFVLSAAAVLLLAGCGSDQVTAPRFEPQIVNTADDFSFQAPGVDGVTQTLEYTWENSGGTANVTQSSSISTPAGSATLVIIGGANNQVYSRSLTEVGTFTTSPCMAGTWKIRVILSDARGTINFRVQKGG
jgi:hypothetical protein